MKTDETFPRPALSVEPGRREPAGPIVWGAGRSGPGTSTGWRSSMCGSPAPSRSSSIASRPPCSTTSAAGPWPWGGPADRVVVIDEDQGRSGQTAEGRLGLPAAPGRGRPRSRRPHPGDRDEPAGPVVQGLASTYWSCVRIFQTLLADQDGLYDPSDYNDRLLLGPEGDHERGGAAHPQGSDDGRAGGTRPAAASCSTTPPIGYVRLPGGGMTLDPDEQARDVVRLIFDKFDELGTVSGVLRYLVRHGSACGVRPHFGPDQRRSSSGGGPTG